MSQQAIDQFYTELVRVGKEVLEQGLKSGFGMSLIEIKFEHGVPRVMVTSHTKSLKFGDNDHTRSGIQQLLLDLETQAYDGTRTFTVVVQKGKVNRVLLDDYENKVLQ